MAAAGRRDQSDPALQEILDIIADLQSQCLVPSELEIGIELFQSDLEDLTRAVENFQRPLSEATKLAIRIKLQNLGYAVNAFYDYVQTRKGREDHIHVVGRAQVAQYLRDVLDDTLSYFEEF